MFSTTIKDYWVLAFVVAGNLLSMFIWIKLIIMFYTNIKKNLFPLPTSFFKQVTNVCQISAQHSQ